MSSPNIQKKPDNSWDETIRTVLVAILLAVIFRSFAFEPFHIPSGSMKSTLLVGDYLFVSKYSYGYSRYSFPFGLPLFEGRIMEREHPQRGDVVVFREPADTRIDFIKRVIGLPGDTIQVKEGMLYINGQMAPRQPLDNFLDNENPNNVQMVPQFKETLPGGKAITILKQHKYFVPEADDTEVFIVPPGHYFMMGDNRDNSHDSRFPDLRYVPEENIVGHAQMIFFSTDGTAHWDNPVSWFKAMRFNRFFSHIH